jgi:hypothetical protein
MGESKPPFDYETFLAAMEKVRLLVLAEDTHLHTLDETQMKCFTIDE